MKQVWDFGFAPCLCLHGSVPLYALLHASLCRPASAVACLGCKLCRQSGACFKLPLRGSRSLLRRLLLGSLRRLHTGALDVLHVPAGAACGVWFLRLLQQPMPVSWAHPGDAQP